MHTRQAKSRSPHCSSVTLPATTRHQLPVVDVDVALLHEQAAEHALVVALARRLHAALAVAEDPQRRLRAQRLERLVVELGREQHLDEVLRDPRGRARRETGRLRTSTQPNAETGSAASARSYASSIDAGDGDAARVRVLDDHRGRQRELAHDAAGALEVGEVVVRELLAAELLDAREQVPAQALLGVVRGALVRVLAVRRGRRSSGS